MNPIGGTHLECQKMDRLMSLCLVSTVHCGSFNHDLHITVFPYPQSVISAQWCNKSRQNYHLEIEAKCVLLTCLSEEM